MCVCVCLYVYMYVLCIYVCMYYVCMYVCMYYVCIKLLTIYAIYVRTYMGMCFWCTWREGRVHIWYCVFYVVNYMASNI